MPQVLFLPLFLSLGFVFLLSFIPIECKGITRREKERKEHAGHDERAFYEIVDLRKDMLFFLTQEAFFD